MYANGNNNGHGITLGTNWHEVTLNDISVQRCSEDGINIIGGADYFYILNNKV